jgi:lipopolysaccharide/colanic/teichoic acid biosynthesis glycosyltransferase
MRQMTAYVDNVSLLADAVDVRELERTLAARDDLRKSSSDGRRLRLTPSPKRVVDIALSTTLLVVFAPLMLLLAALIVLDSRGPVFYRCRRVGWQGREFGMVKFRKMHRDAAGPALTSAHDERFTRVGAFLARTKLDELPQLWNVLTGEMSLVGPRPEDRRFVALDPSGYSEILRVRPGVTGLSQLAFTKESQLFAGADGLDVYTERILPQKIAIDCLYGVRRSMAMDLQILAWTLAAVMLGIDIAVDRQTGRLSVRRRRRRAYPKE